MGGAGALKGVLDCVARCVEGVGDNQGDARGMEGVCKQEEGK